MTPSIYPTSATIRRLDPKLINQIAAGEVVVRPASAVKELIENSLDAGAGRIDVTVEADARAFTVRDDGRGMTAEDAGLAIERHTTSKIRELDDLKELTTRGFRGEALAAIASVSRFELLTRRHDEKAGLRLRCEGGLNVRAEPHGAPPGTAIAVRDLFYNTPARMKFLRSPVSEWGHVLKEFIRQALTRPEVGFSIRWRDRPYLTLRAGQSLAERLAAVLPGSAGEDLLQVETELHGVRVTGCIGSPGRTRRDRRHQHYFANGRPIVSRPLTFALQEAYRGLIMTQQFPVGAIFVELRGEDLDVNVHPTKDEVRFQNESLVAGAIHRAALEALRGADLVPTFDLPSTPGGKFARRGPIGGARNETPAGPGATPGFFKPGGAAAHVASASPARQTEALAAAGGEPAPPPGDPSPQPSAAPAAPPPEDAEAYPDAHASEEAALIRRLTDAPAPPVVLAQIERTYILAEAPGVGLLLIDQHAAHEKILYRQFMNRPPGREVQPLLVPHTHEAGPAAMAAIEALAPALRAAGFDVEPFGGGTLAVQSVPVEFNAIDLDAFLEDLIDEFGRDDLTGAIAQARRRIGARAACRAATMAGDALTRSEMERLLAQVLETSDALRCPHGRPTMMLLSKEQLDRQFGRLG